MSGCVARPEYCPQNFKPGWRTVALKRSFDVRLGKMLQREPFTPADVSVPYLKANNVQWGIVALDDLPEMWASPKEIREFSIQPGDLLVCEGGEAGRSAILSECPQSEVDLTPFSSVTQLLKLTWLNALKMRLTILPTASTCR